MAANGKIKIKNGSKVKVVFTICRYVALSQDWVGDSLNLYARQNFGGETRVGDDGDHIAGVGDGGGHSAPIGDG